MQIYKLKAYSKKFNSTFANDEYLWFVNDEYLYT